MGMFDYFLSLQKCELDSCPLREETAEELALVVSPQPRRSSPAGPAVPSIEVVSPWAGAWREETTWSQGDQTPLLNSSQPSSDAGNSLVLLN